MMKKIQYLGLCAAAVLFTGCGGSSSDGGSSPDPEKPVQPKPPVETVSKCDRGVLLNSILPTATQSIFDEPLYQLTADLKRSNTQSAVRIYMSEFNRDGQMLYRQFHGINISDQELDQDENKESNNMILNNHGLFTTANYQKQNQGWPSGYIVAAQGQALTTAQYNDRCDFNASASQLDYEKVDLSGKKIADVFPALDTQNQPKNVRYKYVTEDVLNWMGRLHQTEYNQLLQSTATFPAGSYMYVPKSVIYKDTQFYFGGSSDLVNTLERWKEHYESPMYGGQYKFKIDKIAGYNVTYSVDAQGNELYYPGADPAMEKDGKIYTGLWIGKGDVISTSYGAQDGIGDNYLEKGQFIYMNASSYKFIDQQIKTYYK